MWTFFFAHVDGYLAIRPHVVQKSYLISEEEKSVEQKERADHLLKELLELIDERDRLEKRKMDSLRV